jgi:hypothetical protein
MPSNPQRRVAATPEQIQTAERLKAAGFGSQNAEPFNVEEDKMAMLAMESNAPQPPEQPQEPPQQPEEEIDTEGTPEDKEEQQQPFKLSESPQERCKQIENELSIMCPGKKIPTAETLFGWKQMHGELYMQPLGKDVYIYRYLKRAEMIALKAKKEFQTYDQDQIDEEFCKRCMLWPAFDSNTINFKQANTIGLLAEQIRMRSHFLDPGYVASLTIAF